MDFWSPLVTKFICTISEFQGGMVPWAGGKRTCYCCLLNLCDTNNAHLWRKNQPGKIPFPSCVQISVWAAHGHIYSSCHLSLLRPPISTPSPHSADCFASYISKVLSKLPPPQSSVCASYCFLEKQLWAPSQGLRCAWDPIPSCLLENIINSLLSPLHHQFPPPFRSCSSGHF